MKNIKLLVCYHKPGILLKDEVMLPIHVGRTIAKRTMSADDPKLQWLLENTIGDDTGDNISELNGSYNELTALYWAWKNYDSIGNPDYIGLMHYRRHFVLNEGEIKVYNYNADEVQDVNAYLEKLNYSPEKLSNLLDDCEFICHLGKVDNIHRHYLDNHRPEDIRLALSLMEGKYKQAAEAYMRETTGNFCNMFIFPKDIFFDYCEWIFGILKKFMAVVNTEDKRLFISERLTGIYIYNLMQEKHSYKVLPISFIAEPVTVPIALPLSEEKADLIEVVVASALKNMKSDTTYKFYLLSNETISENTKSAFEQLKQISDRCTFTFLQSDIAEQYFPLVLSELIDEEKCLYLTEKMLILKDLSNFYRTCSVDDYYAVGIAKGTADIYSEDKFIRTNAALWLHCGKFRKHKIYDACVEDIHAGQPCDSIFNRVCRHQIGYYPYWFVEIADNSKHLDNTALSQVRWKPLLYFGTIQPWFDKKNQYAVFWKECVQALPFKNDIYSMTRKTAGQYDVGIVGWWYNENYGGTLTYYALNRLLKSMGLSVLMIDRPSANPNNKPKSGTIPRRFAEKYYDISAIYDPNKMGVINPLCDVFISGSDQIYADWAWAFAGQTNHLDFAAPLKNTIGYATSFGNTYEATPEETMRSSYLLHRFSSLSVREDYAVDIVKENFGLDVVQVLDPVFMCDSEEYHKLAESSSIRKEQDYVLSFFLDPDEKKREALLHISEHFNLPYNNLIHAMNFEENSRKLNLDNIKANADVEEWLAYYRDADFIITDSFHGTCFAIIFKKPFISIANVGRGEKRFESLLGGFGLMNRLVYDIDEIMTNEKLFEPIDYDKVYEILEKKKSFSYAWLYNAIFNPPKKSTNSFNIMDKKVHDNLMKVFRLQDIVFKQQ
ncbi:MAG: DUF4422 domain-containing protein, partial [Acutalibacteraceae bacterium]